MLHKLIALSVIFGLVLADPVAKLTPPSYDDLQVQPLVRSLAKEESKTLDLIAAAPDLLLPLAELFPTAVGLKLSALSIAVKVIEWLVSNILFVAFGAIATLGFCKITGKCDVIYKKFIPIESFHSLVTPEHLVTAEQFLVNAFGKYAEEKKRSGKNISPWF